MELYMESLEGMLSNCDYRSDWTVKDTNSLNAEGANRVYLVSKAGGGVPRVLLIRNAEGQYEPPIVEVDQINAKLIHRINNAAKQALAIDVSELNVLSGFKTPAAIISEANSFDEQWNHHAKEAKNAKEFPDYVMARIDNLNTLLNHEQNDFARIHNNQAQIKVMDWYIPVSVNGLLSMDNYNRLIGD